MEGYASANDIAAVVAADKAHVWHHLSQHKGYEQANGGQDQAGQDHEK